MAFVGHLARVYREHPEFWRRDPDGEGFNWISADDRENSVLVFARRDGERHSLVVMNMTPVPRDHYRIGVPEQCTYREVINTDANEWAGSGHPTHGQAAASLSPFHGFPQSIELSLPPLSVLVLSPERTAGAP
jgi:1,4-alpha-glucan branching enzyme